MGLIKYQYYIALPRGQAGKPFNQMQFDSWATFLAYGKMVA